MLKLTYCLTRLPALDRAGFQHYWRNVHAPLVAAAAPALGIRRYIQSHSLDPAASAALAASRGDAGDYDGVAELWWDDAAALAAAIASPDGARHAAILLADEARFIDLPRSPIFLVDERVVVG